MGARANFRSMFRNNRHFIDNIPVNTQRYHGMKSVNLDFYIIYIAQVDHLNKLV